MDEATEMGRGDPAESVIQVAAQVLGNDTVVTLGAQWGVLDLNTMMPVMASNLLKSIYILGTAGG